MIHSSTSSKDELLGQLLQKLGTHGIARRWGAACTPYSDLDRECDAVGTDVAMLREFSRYLSSNKVISLTVETLLANLSVSSLARADQVPWPARMLAHRGVWISRWLPMFLIIDGPLGGFLRSPESPLNILLRNDYKAYPTLAQARDLFNHDLFRRVRNGVAHWSFVFEGEDATEQLVCFDWESGARTVVVSVLEAEALFMTSFSIVECLDEKVFRRARAQAVTPSSA